MALMKPVKLHQYGDLTASYWRVSGLQADLDKRVVLATFSGYLTADDRKLKPIWQTVLTYEGRDFTLDLSEIYQLAKSTEMFQGAEDAED